VLLAEGGVYETHLRARGLVNIKVALSSLRRGLRAHMAADVATLTRSDIVGAIDEHTPGAATDLRKFVHGLLEWSVATGRAPHNVLAGLRMPVRTRHQRLRDGEETGRALSDVEVVRVWRACEELQARAMAGEPVSGSFAGLAQLALLTGLRRGELAKLERTHIRLGECAGDEEDGISGPRIRLPPSITKTGRSHSVPVTSLMMRVTSAQPVTTSKLVFPSSRTGGPISGWSKLLPKLQDLSGVSFGMHDLRRTLRTMLDKLGVGEDVAELCIGHARADLIQRYNKNMAWDARTEAFEAVSRHISALLAGDADDRSNVIAMHGRDGRPTG
jgi:integrase